MLKVSDGGSGRVNVAGMVCLKAGERSRLLYRMRVYHRRKGENKGLTEADFAALLSGAHQLLGGPLVLVWDNVNTHQSPTMRQFIDEHEDWLTVFHLPKYAHELNPAEGAWAQIKSGLGNFAVPGIDALAALIRTKLKRQQHRPALIDGFIAGTGLDFGIPEPAPAN